MFLPPLTMSIDLVTLGYSKLRKRYGKTNSSEPIKKIRTSVDSVDKQVSVLIPAFNEGEKIHSTIDCILKQTYPVKGVYILDDISTDSTMKICNELATKHNNVYHIRRDKRLGKAGNINALVQERANELGEFVLIVDGDVKLEKHCLEKLVNSSDNAAVVTGLGYTMAPNSYIGKMLFEGESWLNSIFSFRKKAQVIRNAVFVVCGGLSLYRKDVLKDIPIPERTLTEDTDYTWLLQEKGHKIKYDDKAIGFGNNPETLKNNWKRYMRWFSGTFQGLYSHGFKELNKSKPLLYSTIAPGVIESVPYSLTISALPITAVFYPELAAGILIADFVLSAPFLFMHKKGFWHALNHLPDIYAYKYFGSLACAAAGIKTTAEKILGKEDSWKNNWENSSRASIKTKVLKKRVMKNNLGDFLGLEKNWTSLGEEAWTENNFILELPNKWKLSSYATVNGKPVGYTIVSRRGEREACLNKILVDSSYQGLGIGSMLLERSIDGCRQRNINKLVFKVRTDNKAAISLYKKYGVSIQSPVMCSDNVERYLCEMKL